jgi:hypothetical protein
MGRKHVGLSLARTPRVLRDVRLHDRSPAENTNVLGSDRISMTSAATLNAFECCLGLAIRFCDLAARWAGARGISRINQHGRDTRKHGFVRDKGLQLKERPAMQYGALRLPSPEERANVLEIFKRNPSLCAFCYRTENPLARSGAVGRSMGNRKLTGK